MDNFNKEMLIRGLEMIGHLGDSDPLILKFIVTGKRNTGFGQSHMEQLHETQINVLRLETLKMNSPMK